MKPHIEKLPSSLVELLQIRAADPGNRTSYRFLDDDDVWDTARLADRARAIGAALQSTGNVGDRVLLLYPPGLEFLAVFFGCLFAGQIAVPVYPPGPRNLKKLQGIAASSGATTICTLSTLLSVKSSLMSEAFEHAAWLATDEIPTTVASLWKSYEPTSQQTAFLQYTSGSTASPKGVIVSHGNLLHQLHSLKRMTAFSSEDRVMSWLPPYHDMGLIGGLLTPVYCQMPLMLMSPVSFLRRPLRWLEAITRHQASVAVAPNFAYELCARNGSNVDLSAFDLSSLRVMMSGAEPVRVDTLRRFFERFRVCGARWDAFYPCYGLAEGTLMATGCSRGEGPRSVVVDLAAYEQGRIVPRNAGQPGTLELTSCGRSVPEQALRIVDPETRLQVPDGCVGEIWLSGPSVAQGYWDLAEESRATFGCTLADAPELGGHLRTGDLGFQLDGAVYVSGRLKDLIVLNGLKYHPEDLEFSLIGCHPALRPGCAVIFSAGTQRDQIVLVQEIEGVDDGAKADVVQAVQRAVRSDHGVELDVVVLVAPRTIPKTSSGKFQRSACRTAFLADQLEGYRSSRSAMRHSEPSVGDAHP